MITVISTLIGMIGFCVIVALIIYVVLSIVRYFKKKNSSDISSEQSHTPRNQTAQVQKAAESLRVE